MYGCSNCGELKFVSFRCKSRFCPTCGNKYSIDRTTAMSFKIILCQHRHCIFTISKELRSFFLKDRSLLNCLFHAVSNVVLPMFSKVSKSEHFVPGLFVYSILSGVAFNGILISIVLSLKVVLETYLLGVLSNTLITSSFVMLFVLLYLMKCILSLVIPLKK